MNNDKYFRDNLILSDKEVAKREQAYKEDEIKAFIINFKAKLNSEIFKNKLLNYSNNCIDNDKPIHLIYTYPGLDTLYTLLIAIGVTPIDTTLYLEDSDVLLGEPIEIKHGSLTEKDLKYLSKKCYGLIQDKLKELKFKIKDNESYNFKQKVTNYFDLRLINK